MNLLPMINTGIAHARPGVGQVGAGLARAPLACFPQRWRTWGADSDSMPLDRSSLARGT